MAKASFILASILLTCTFSLTFARSVCTETELYSTVANELGELGLVEDLNEFRLALQRALEQMQRPGQTSSPECLRFFFRTYLAKLRSEYPAEDVQRFLIKWNPEFTPPEQCEDPESYDKLGQELGVLGQNVDYETRQAIIAKYPEVKSEDFKHACIAVMRNAYRKAYKEAGFYDTPEGQQFVNRIDEVGYLLEESSEKRK